MAGEIKVTGPGPGLTVYANIYGSGNSVWSTTSGYFENFTSGNWQHYAQSMTEQAVSAVYVGNMPALIPGGSYDVVARQQTFGSPLMTDGRIGAGIVEWNTVGVNSLFYTATSGQVGQTFPMRIARGIQVLNFPLYLKSAADHVTPFVSGAVSGQISRDGGAFGPLQSGAITEKGLGFYSLQALTSGDLLANTVSLLFTAAGVSGGSSDPLPLGIVLQRTSGQP